MGQEQKKREFVLIKLGNFCKGDERRRLIGGTRLSVIDEIQPAHQRVAISSGQIKMSNSKANRWTAAELDRLRSLLDAGKTAREIAVALDRTPLAIYGQVQRLYRKRDPAKARRDPGDWD